MGDAIVSGSKLYASKYTKKKGRSCSRLESESQGEVTKGYIRLALFNSLEVE